jgi:two-component system response regulator HydG
MHKLRILILYPDPAGLALLTSMLKSLGHIIEDATNDRMAVRLMERNDIDLVLAGVDPGDGDALELLNYVRRKHREVPVVLLFPRLHPERAKEALRLGAMAVLKYPVPAAELRAAVLQALEQCETRPGEPAAASPATVAASHSGGKPQPIFPTERSGPVPALTLHSSLSESGTAPIASTMGTMAPTALAASANVAPSSLMASPSAALAVHAPATSPAPRVDLIARELGLIGNDPSWRQVLELTATIASARAWVLIVGEPGTGKSLVARLLHTLGCGAQRPFVTVEASALADELATLENENPGSTNPGSTNPAITWSHMLEQARNGTLYIDEISALPAEIQLNLLRELQHRDYGAGGVYPHVPGEVRFLMSTSENLSALIEQGRFHQELFHRVSAICLTLPPLKHRGTDVELLAESFRARYAHEFRKSVVGFTRDALDVLQRHDWPGNVRELEAAIRRAVAMCNGNRITSSHLAPILNHHRQARTGAAPPRPHLPIGIRPLKEALEEPEKRIILQALQAFNWNRQETARVLNINRTTLYKKMKKYGLLIDEPIWSNGSAISNQ